MPVRKGFAAAGVVAAVACLTPPADAAERRHGAGGSGDAVKALTVLDDEITEASGLAASARHPGVLYMHNDSGGAPRIFAVGPDGNTRAVLTLGGASARDWEGMAMGRDEAGRPALYVADIGDNLGGAWPYVTVYRIREPSRLRSQTLHATAFRLKYADGPRNAESIMINPRTNRLYVVSKLFGGALYAAPSRLRADRTNVLREIGDAPALATDAAFAPDGRSYVIRTYFSAHVYTFGDGRFGKELRRISLPDQEQGESIAYTPDARSLLAGSEGTAQPVWRIPLPADARPPSPSSPPAAGTEPADPAEERSVSTGLFIALGLAGAIAYALFRRSRS